MPAFASALDAALHYSSILGWHVFPCRANKTPLTVNGHIDATTDKDQIVAWWRKWPTAQVGVACGASGLCVIDLDYDSGRKLDGPSFFARLEAEHGPNWCDLAASTPRGGRHLIYSMPSPPVGNRANAIPASGIDVRADGGYIVAPSPASPGREWNLGEDWIDEPIETLTTPPEWIDREILGVRRNGTVRTNGVAGKAASVVLLDAQVDIIRSALTMIDPEPRETWIRMAMALKSTGAGQPAFDLWDEYSRRCPVKYDSKVQRQQWDSLKEFFLDGREVTLGSLFHAAREAGWDGIDVEMPNLLAPPQHTGINFDGGGFKAPTVAEQLLADEAPEAPPAKPEVFPAAIMDGDGLLLDVARDIMEIAVFPHPAHAIGAAIALLGTIIGRRVQTDTSLRSNLYVLNVAPTGCGKDSSLRYPHQALTLACEMGMVGPGEWKSDSGLRNSLVAEPSHLAAIDEFGLYLRSSTEKGAAPHLRGIIPTLLQAFSSAGGILPPSAYADQKLNPPRPVIEPNLCVLGATTPATLFDGLTTRNVDDGLLGRTLVFVAGNDVPKRRKRVRVQPSPAIIDRLKALSKATKIDGSIAGMASNARTLPFSAKAEAYLDAVEDVEQGHRDDPGPFAPLWLRLAEHVRKLALVRQVTDDPTSEEIGEPAVHWGHLVVDWCIRRFECEVGARLADNEVERDTKRVLEIIRAGCESGGKAGGVGVQHFNASMLTRKTQWLRRHDRKEILASLVESGQVVATQVEVTRAGRGKTVQTTYRLGR